MHLYFCIVHAALNEYNKSNGENDMTCVDCMKQNRQRATACDWDARVILASTHFDRSHEEGERRCPEEEALWYALVLFK